MIQVSLKPHPYFENLVEIWVDEDLFREFQAKYLKKFSLVGQYESLAVWQDLFEEWERRSIKSTILQKLRMRSYLSVEIARSLLEAGFHKDQVERVIEECRELHLFPDEDQIRNLILRAINACKGPYWIKQTLKEKGVQGSIENLLEELYPREKRCQIIQHFLTKSKKDFRKNMSSLQRRGFSLEEILEARSVVF